MSLYKPELLKRCAKRWSIAATGVALLISTACQMGATDSVEHSPPPASTSPVATSAAAASETEASGAATETPQAYASTDSVASASQEAAKEASEETSSPDAPLLPEITPQDKPLEAPEGVPEELAVVWQVWSILAAQHVDRETFDPEIFTEASIRGMLEALDDQHTNYISPDVFGIEQEDIHGQFEGIGAHVSLNADGRLVIVAPIEGSPAERAGVRPGDIVLEVDGESLEGVSLLEAVSKIRGPRGSTVKLTVQHLGEPEKVIIEIRRGIIPLQSVVLRSEPGQRIAHIRLTNFYQDTANKLSSTIHEALDSGSEGIILDVRDNPGGLLGSVVDVTSLFLDSGLILYEVDGDGQRNDWLVRRKDDRLEEVPIVMIANGFSASASEILIGALQDHDRAVVVGTKTFGKGSVGILKQLDNGGGIALTIARWYTPDGRVIDREGLEPDIEISGRDPQEEDIMQLQKAIEILEEELNKNASARPAA